MNHMVEKVDIFNGIDAQILLSRVDKCALE